MSHLQPAALANEPAGTSFDPSVLRGLPQAARRWLLHSVPVGTPLWTRVELELEGHLRIGSWRPFSAHQTIRPRHGYTWSATTQVAHLPVTGLESMSPAVGRKVWRAAGMVSVVQAEGPEVLNSSAGRLAAESVFVPTAFGSAAWEPSADPDSAFATWRIGPRVDRVRLEVAPSGRLRSVSLRRWGTPPGQRYGRHLFTLRFEDELEVGGVLIPRLVSVHWPDTRRPHDDAVMRAQVLSARFA